MTSIIPMAQFQVLSPAHADYELRHDLRFGDIVDIDGREFTVSARQGTLVTFHDRIDNAVRVLPDNDISVLISKGQFTPVRLVGDVEQGRRAPLRDRRTLDATAIERADRRLDYVLSVLKGNTDPDGEVLRTKSYRARSQTDPIIDTVAERRGEKRPAFTTVLRWVDDWVRGCHAGKACLVPNYEFRGNRYRWDKDILAATAESVRYWLTPRTTAKDAYTIFKSTYERIRRDKGLLDEGQTVPRDEIPSRRTFERWLSAIDAMTRDTYRHGPHHAKKLHKIFQRRERPLVPYEEVEFDHNIYDLQIVDGRFSIVLGRAVVILFVDRATAMVVGYAIGFESPSFASVVEGLRSTMLPKDNSRFPRLSDFWWNPHGRIETLIGDNGMENLGLSIRHACRELGITLRHTRPAHPWEKGQVERAFRSFNEFIADKLGGATLSNSQERRSYDDLGAPFVTIENLEELIRTWIVAFHNAEPTKAVGMIIDDGMAPVPGTKSIPNENWKRAIANLSSFITPTVDATVFDALVAETVERVIGNDGIRFDGITYSHPTLAALRAAERAGAGERRRTSKKYLCRRNPNDLTKIWVANPDRPTDLHEVPVCEAHRSYATGTTRRMHALYKQKAREMLRLQVEGSDDDRIDMKALADAKADFTRRLIELTRDPNTTRIDSALTKFLRGEVTKYVRSSVRSASASASDSWHITYEQKDTRNADVRLITAEPTECSIETPIEPPSPPPPPKSKVAVSPDHRSILEQMLKDSDYE